MATKKFTNHAQRVLNHNPNVIRCTEARIIFTDAFALRVCTALQNGRDPYQVFADCGLSVRVLGKSRVNGAIGLWKSKYELENIPRRKSEPKVKKPTETAVERRERNLEAAINECNRLVADPTLLSLDPETSRDTIHFAAIKKVYDSKMPVVVKDLCAHYGYSYSKYYAYLQSFQPKSTFVNILNPHAKRK